MTLVSEDCRGSQMQPTGLRERRRKRWWEEKIRRRRIKVREELAFQAEAALAKSTPTRRLLWRSS